MTLVALCLGKCYHVWRRTAKKWWRFRPAKLPLCVSYPCVPAQLPFLIFPFSIFKWIQKKLGWSTHSATMDAHKLEPQYHHCHYHKYMGRYIAKGWGNRDRLGCGSLRACLTYKKLFGEITWTKPLHPQTIDGAETAWIRRENVECLTGLGQSICPWIMLG